MTKMTGSEIIYAFSFSRDCDMCESTSFHKFESQKEFDDYEDGGIAKRASPTKKIFLLSEISNEKRDL